VAVAVEEAGRRQSPAGRRAFDAGRVHPLAHVTVALDRFSRRGVGRSMRRANIDPSWTSDASARPMRCCSIRTQARKRPAKGPDACFSTTAGRSRLFTGRLLDRVGRFRPPRPTTRAPAAEPGAPTAGRVPGHAAWRSTHAANLSSMSFRTSRVVSSVSRPASSNRSPARAIRTSAVGRRGIAL